MSNSVRPTGTRILLEVVEPNSPKYNAITLLNEGVAKGRVIKIGPKAKNIRKEDVVVFCLTDSIALNDIGTVIHLIAEENILAIL